MDYYITEADVASNSKKLELFDFEKYIETEKLKEVKNSNLIALNDKNSFDTDGLWSETIFGRVGSKERKTRFGYISFSIPMIRPVLFKLMKTYSEDIRDIIAGTRRFKLSKTGELTEDPEVGETGLLFLLSNCLKIDFEACAKKDKITVGKYLNANKRLVFISKYWIIPPGGIRDVSLNRNSGMFASEINDIYEKIISLKDQLELYEFDDEMRLIIINELNNFLLQAHTWVQSKMTGKGGLLRGTMLKKSVDYSSRIIATTDPNIPFGSVGLPWHTLFVLYEPFAFHYILKVKPEIQNIIKAALDIQHENPLNMSELKRLTALIQLNVNNINPELKEALFECVQYITKNKDIVLKRDPVVWRGNYTAASIIPLKEGRGIVVNPLNCPSMTLDFDGDCIAEYPVFSKEGLKEVEKLNPAKNKSIWRNMLKQKSQIYNLQLDALSTIYAATKDPN